MQAAGVLLPMERTLMSPRATIIRNGRIVRSDLTVDGHLLVEDSVISYPGREPPGSDGEKA